MKSEVESAELFVNSLIENPVEVKANKLVPVGIRHWYTMSIFYQWDRHYCAVFTKRDLNGMNRLLDKKKFDPTIERREINLKCQSHVLLNVSFVGQ